jgi:hypothetical protein
MTDSPELEQARYAWARTQHNANHGTVRWCIEAFGLLDGSEGPEAKRFLRLRRFFISLLKDQAADLEKAVRRAARYGLKAPVYNLRAGMPVVQGQFLIAKQVLRWSCPFCGEQHSHRAGDVPLRITLACPANAADRCEVEPKYFRATIPMYIPGRSP